MKISIRKKSRGNAGSRKVGSDVYVSKVINNGRKLGLSIRVSRDCMDSLRWRAGDRVLIDFEREQDTGTLTLTRTDSLEEGLCISALSKGGSGQIRASLEPDYVPVMFPNGRQGYHGQIVHGGPRVGQFLIDYAAVHDG
jgi:hypothetical protein